MKLYRIEMKMHATAYVKAETPEEAAQIAANELSNNVVTLENDDCEIVSDADFESALLPDFSLSPAATVGEVDGEPEEVDE